MAFVVTQAELGYALRNEQASGNAVGGEIAKALGALSADGRIELVLGDITQQNVEAVVNAANSLLVEGGGVDGAIHNVGGSAIRKELEEKYPYGCLPGDAVISTAGKLPAKYVIHAVGPVYSKSPNDPLVLASAYEVSLRLCSEHNIKSVAFPSISTGAYEYPVEEAAPIALRTVREYLNIHSEIIHVRFILFDKRTFQAYTIALSALDKNDSLIAQYSPSIHSDDSVSRKIDALATMLKLIVWEAPIQYDYQRRTATSFNHFLNSFGTWNLPLLKESNTTPEDIYYMLSGNKGPIRTTVYLQLDAMARLYLILESIQYLHNSGSILDSKTILQDVLARTNKYATYYSHTSVWAARRLSNKQYQFNKEKYLEFIGRALEIIEPQNPYNNAARAGGEVVAAATGVFKEGDRVRHIKFGVGRILKIAQQKFADAEAPVYKIEFPAGEKEIAVFPGTQSPLSLVESEKAEEQPQINHGMADEIEKAINEITEEAYRRLDAIREEQGRHFTGEWLIPKLNTNKDKLKAALRKLPPEQCSAAISRLRQLESRAHLFFLAAIYNISDILKFIQIDTASGRFVAADKDFQYFLDNFTTNYHNLSPAEILGLLKFQPAVPLVVPVLWQLLARGNIKDLVWEAASHERRELEGKGIQPIRLANLNDPATVRMVLEEVRQQRYLEKTLHGDILRATGHRIKEFDDKPELLDIYADEIAQVLGISLEKRKKDFAGSVKKAEQVQGYLNRLIYRRDKGIEFQLSPRNLEELRYGDLCGDCTASFSKEHTGVAVNFWTVPVWIGCQTHFILTEYRDGQFYAKYNIAVMTGSSGEPVLYVHATEVSSKASAGSEIFKDQGIREEMLQSGIAKIFEIAREANIRTVYFLPLSNTDWVEQIMEDRLQTIEDVMLSKFGGADLTARFCERHSSSTPAIRGIYIQGFEGATDDTAVIGSLLTEQVVDPERIKAVILQYEPEAEQGKVNAVVNLVLSHKRKIDVSDDIRIIDLYGELIDNVHEAESDYCKMKEQEFLSKQIKKERISLDVYEISETLSDFFDRIYGIPVGQLHEKGKIEDETIARLEEMGLEHGQAVRFVESAFYIYRIEIDVLLPFAGEKISYEEARKRCIEQGLSSEEATGLLDGMASYLKEATGVDILGTEVSVAGAAARAGGEGRTSAIGSQVSTHTILVLTDNLIEAQQAFLQATGRADSAGVTYQVIPSDYSLSDIQEARAMASGFNQVAYLFTNPPTESAILANLTGIDAVDLSDEQAAKAALASGVLQDV